MEKAFWSALDHLLDSQQTIIDRPKGSAHPRFPHVIYPLDYGYLQGTSSMDGSGIDVWLGSGDRTRIDAVICTVDLMKKDSEVKLLIGCSEMEMQTALAFHNDSAYMKGILIKRRGSGDE